MFVQVAVGQPWVLVTAGTRGTAGHCDLGIVQAPLVHHPSTRARATVPLCVHRNDRLVVGG